MARGFYNRCPICEQPLRAGSCSNFDCPGKIENSQNKFTSQAESSAEQPGGTIRSYGDRLENNRISRPSLDSRETFMASRTTSYRGQEYTFQGIVRNLEWKEKNYGVHSSGSSRTISSLTGETSEVRTDRFDRYEILTFRIEQIDGNGNISYVPIYLKAREIEGVISDGDEVKVTGEMDETKTVNPSSILVLNTGGYIKITRRNGSDYLPDHPESSGCLSIFIVVIPIPFLLAFFLA